MENKIGDFEQARSVWPPEPGPFKIRLVSRGWAVPALIMRTIRTRDDNGFAIHVWHAVIDGIAREAAVDPARAEDVARIWHNGERISESDYAWLVATGDWARAHDPRHPAANPLRPIDPSRLRPIRPRTPHK